MFEAGACSEPPVEANAYDDLRKALQVARNGTRLRSADVQTMRGVNAWSPGLRRESEAVGVR
jgi:hypothetical protein